MRDTLLSAALDASRIGRQDLVRGDGTAASTDNTALAGAATQTASLTKTYPIDVAGCASLRALLRPNVLTGTPTATIVPALADGVTADPTVTPVAISLALNTAAAATLALTGSRIVLLVITTPAASTVAFNIAEFTAK